MDNDRTIRTQSGRSLDELTLAAVLEGQLTEEDFRISAETLAHQADRAQAAGYPELAQNLRRAAELTRLSNEQALEIYNALRPGRTTYKKLLRLANWLESELAAPLTGALIREAAEIYLERGLVPEL
ncbi:MAG: diol dehydratase small subunit [Anaerolineae bacterium]